MINTSKSTVFTPYGLQLKKVNPWYAQELCQEWPHQASALTLGESNVVKYGVNYPLRTGLTPLKETDFPEFTIYLPLDDCQVEEILVSRGVCVVSHGPIGGLSHLKGIYRTLTSYGTGGGIKSVVKTTFSSKEGQEKVTYLCLVENGGISLYAEGSSENHVAYMPQFNIDRVISCKFGLLVIPTEGKEIETEDDKGIYVLTHPIKQISKVLLKRPSDCTSYNNEKEKILCCYDDLCVFWNNNESIVLRRLVRAEKKDVLQCSGLSSTTCFTNHEHSGRPYTPAGSTLFSPIGKTHHKSAMRVNREGTTTCYWPTFDFTESTVPGPGLALGFYPPHVCVYDEPELAFNTLFNIDLAKGRWIEPRKVQIVQKDECSNLALWLLIKHNLYLHGIDIESGSKLSHWALKDIDDFSCPTEKNQLPILIVLLRSGQLKIGWLDDDFKIVGSAIIQNDIEKPISGVDCVLFGDTIICTLKGERYQKASLQLKNYRKNGLIRRCIDGLRKHLPSEISSKLIGGCMGQNTEQDFGSMWKEFIGVILNVLLDVSLELRFDTALKTYRAIESLREHLKLTTSCNNYLGYLSNLVDSLADFLNENFPTDFVASKSTSLFVKFGRLLLVPRSTVAEHPDFETLPEVMQLLLDNPDSVKNMEKLSIIKTEEEYFTPLFEILIADVFQRNISKVQFDWPASVISCMGRTDYLSGLPGYYKSGKDKVFEIFTPYREREDVGDEPSWVNHVLNMRVFAEDRRLEEVCRLLDSASPLTIDVEQRAEMSDHEFVEEQEKHLLQLVQITFSAPVGRTSFTLRTEEKNFANLTSNIHIPKLCLTGKCSTKGTSIELNETDLPHAYTAWPTFHNAVASALSVRFTDKPADAWFAYNKAKTNEGPEQAGMILGFGLNGILSSMPPTLRHEHLAKENSYTSMAMLLGLSANLAGTGDISTWKVISLHIGAMLPSCTTELEIPRLATLVAPCALGLLFLGTHNSHIAKVLLGEISKRYSPLSVFGGGNSNNSITNVNVETNGVTGDRESHSLCSGFGLGFVNLGKARSNPAALEEDGIDGILRRFVVGGPKPANFNMSEDEDMYNQFGQTVPSLWEEYRCCHIEEGDNVNVDVTTPSAIIAVSLIYLRSGNEAVLKWLSPPSTLHLLDGVRPDLLMLRSLASILVFESISHPDVQWLEECLMPQALRQNALRQPEKQSRIDHESINQAWASIVCGYCLGLAIRFAGTSDVKVKEILWHYTNLLLEISLPGSKLSEYFPKNFLESSVCTLLIALSLIHAGTGDIPVLRLCRYLQSKVSSTQITVSSNTYGLEMCISMATGILFLGGGRYSLSNDDKSIAVLLAAVFPKWPINATDNRYHLQALRHLYILAAQPRLILPKPMPRGSKLKFRIEYLDGQKTKAYAPVLLPPFHLLKRIWLDESDFLPVEFNLPKDLPYLKKIVECGGILNLVQKPIGSIKYNFTKKMSWRKNHVFHKTFLLDDKTNTEEQFEVQELNLISRLSEWVGMRHIVPAFLALRNGDPNDEDWQWQLRILYWWVTVRSKDPASSIRLDLLALLLNKAKEEFKIFPSSSEINVSVSTT